MSFLRRINETAALAAMVTVVIGCVFPSTAVGEDGADELVFIVAADMRSAATGGF